MNKSPYQVLWRRRELLAEDLDLVKSVDCSKSGNRGNPIDKDRVTNVGGQPRLGSVGHNVFHVSRHQPHRMSLRPVTRLEAVGTAC
jgi:hypothetical protein